MKKKKILSAIFLVLSIGMIGILFIMGDDDRQTEQNTEEFVATVFEIRITDLDNGGYVDIFTEEYDTSLFISSELGAKMDISELQKGEKIAFRIERKKAELLDQVEFIDIVSLESQYKTYISLSDYNAYKKESLMPARIVAVALTTFFFFAAVYIWIKRNKTKQKKD